MFGSFQNFFPFYAAILIFAAVYLWFTSPGRKASAFEASVNQFSVGLLSLLGATMVLGLLGLASEISDTSQSELVSRRAAGVWFLAPFALCMAGVLVLSLFSGIFWGLIGRRSGHAHLSTAAFIVLLFAGSLGGAYLLLNVSMVNALNAVVITEILKPVFGARHLNGIADELAQAVVMLGIAGLGMVVYWALLFTRAGGAPRPAALHRA